MTKLQLGIGAAILALGCGALVWQHRANTQLAEENAALHAAAQHEAPRPTPAASEAATTTSTGVSGAKASSGVPTATHPTAHERPMTSTLAAGLTPVDGLGNAGTATPQATFATQLWAARTGDVDLEASVIAVTPEGRQVLEELLTHLPKTITQPYDTPEKLLAWALAGSPHPVGGMQIVSATPQGPDDVVLATKWQHIDDDIVHESDIHLHRTGDAWKMIVPTALVHRVAAYLERAE